MPQRDSDRSARSPGNWIGVPQSLEILNRTPFIPAATATLRCSGRSELQREVHDRLLVPIHAAEIKLRRDETYLVADPVRNQRRFGVVEDDAISGVEQAGRMIHLGDDGIESERQDLVSE